MGKVIGIGIVMIALLAGAAMYYLQVYHFYEPVEASGTDDVRLVNIVTGAPEPVCCMKIFGPSTPRAALSATAPVSPRR